MARKLKPRQTRNSATRPVYFGDARPGNGGFPLPAAERIKLDAVRAKLRTDFEQELTERTER